MKWRIVDACESEVDRSMFIGSYEHSLDPKGRVSLPARFRDVLAGFNGDARLVLTTNVDPGGCCLVGYAYPEWVAFHEKIESLPQFDENVIRLKRLHIAGASECAPDRQGRISIPPVLRDYAGLSGSVILAGVGNCIEIWDSAAWAAERERAKESLPAINDAMARLGL